MVGKRRGTPRYSYEVPMKEPQSSIVVNAVTNGILTIKVEARFREALPEQKAKNFPR